MVQLLLEFGADPNILDTNGHSPLYTAVDKGEIKLAKMLIDYNADPSKFV